MTLAFTMLDELCIGDVTTWTCREEYLQAELKAAFQEEDTAAPAVADAVEREAVSLPDHLQVCLCTCVTTKTRHMCDTRAMLLSATHEHT